MTIEWSDEMFSSMDSDAATSRLFILTIGFWFWLLRRHLRTLTMTHIDLEVFEAQMYSLSVHRRANIDTRVVVKPEKYNCGPNSMRRRTLENPEVKDQGPTDKMSLGEKLQHWGPSSKARSADLRYPESCYRHLLACSIAKSTVYCMTKAKVPRASGRYLCTPIQGHISGHP